MANEEWITTRELAAREGISRATLWRWVEKGLIEAKREGARTGVRVRPAAPAAVEVKASGTGARCALCGCSCRTSPPSPDAVWRTIRDFCEHYGVGRTSVHRWRAAGVLQQMWLDGRVRVRLLDERDRWPP